MSKQKQPFSPPIRFAPPGVLNAYVVYEHQLDLLAQGSPASLMLNYSLFFLGVASTALGTIFSVPTDNDRAYYTFLLLFLVALVAGVVLLGLWWRAHQSVKNLIVEIKSQMPPNPEGPARLEGEPPSPNE